jgi:hypothetical protein
MAETRTSSRRVPLLIAGAVFALICGYALVLNVTQAGAARAKLLGKTSTTPAPQCPLNCSALGSVTGIQTKVQGMRNPFKVRATGHIVAWSAELGKPDKEDREFFGDLFTSDTLGKVPTARISVLRNKGHRQYKLLKQSPPVSLSGYYNERVTLTLTEPLRVREGDVVAITTPTWAPILVSASRARASRWRASRSKGKCGVKAAKKAKPQQKVGSTREYGCTFNDRLLYWAYFVPS